MIGPLFTVTLAVLVAAGAAWFWTHCADPELRHIQAPPLARRVVLAATAAAIIGQVVRVAAIVLDADSIGPFALAVVTGGVWIVVVGLGYLTGYRWLVRVCRAIDGRSFR